LISPSLLNTGCSNLIIQILGRFSSTAFFLRESFTANAARPLVETAPATTIPTVAKQNGHIGYLPPQRPCHLAVFHLDDERDEGISTGPIKK
jgi:hypothetical protein